MYEPNFLQNLKQLILQLTFHMQYAHCITIDQVREMIISFNNVKNNEQKVSCSELLRILKVKQSLYDFILHYLLIHGIIMC